MKLYESGKNFAYRFSILYHEMLSARFTQRSDHLYDLEGDIRIVIEHAEIQLLKKQEIPRLNCPSQIYQH